LGKPLKFEITLEVLPTFELGDYKGMQLKKKPVSVTDEDIENALKAVSRQKTQLAVVKKGKVKTEIILYVIVKLVLMVRQFGMTKNWKLWFLVPAWLILTYLI
jgi:nitrogen regulatory protein PII-like uncharacterized protein